MTEAVTFSFPSKVRGFNRTYYTYSIPSNEVENVNKMVSPYLDNEIEFLKHISAIVQTFQLSHVYPRFYRPQSEL